MTPLGLDGPSAVSCRPTNLPSSFAQRCDLGYEDPLLRPEPDDDPAAPGLDDLPHPELGVPDPLPGAVSFRCGPLELSPTGQCRAPSPPTGRRAGYRAGLQPIRYLREEARGHLVFALSPVRAQLRVGEGKALLCARDADVAEPTFLFEVLLVERAGVREGPLLHAHDEDVVELQPLGVVERHQCHPSALGR